MGISIGASLGAGANGLGWEKGKQPGFTWSLALLCVWKATEQEGHVR